MYLGLLGLLFVLWWAALRKCQLLVAALGPLGLVFSTALVEARWHF